MTRIGIDARVLTHRPAGVARYLRGLLSAWPAVRREGEQLELYVDRPAGRLAGPDDDVAVLRWPLPGGDPAWRQIRLAARLARRPPDVLLCPFYSAPLLCRVPTVVTIHDVSFAAHPEWFRMRARLAFALVRPSARRARAVLTVSEFSAGEIERRLGIARSRITVVPHGLEPAWHAPLPAGARERMRAWLGTGAPYLLHLGAVQRRRRPDLLVEAFAAVAAAHPELALVVAGPTLPRAPDVLRLAARHGVADRVLRREWVPEEHVRPLVKEARALVYLSVYEGFGFPAAEAAALGTPVVALRRASLPEVLGDAAAWVDDETAEAVAAALRSLLDDPRRAGRLAARARERARRFDWRRAAEATFGLLRRAAAPRSEP